MDILFLSPCVPNPPDKGERIRAYHELAQLAARYRVHLACFARNRSEMAHAEELRDWCASVHVEPLRGWRSLRAGLDYVTGKSLTASLYDSPRLRKYVESLTREPLSATVVYSSVMAQYAPPGVPVILDMVNVDSGEWIDYSQARSMWMFYLAEGKRLRRIEAEVASQAACTFLSTWNEVRLLESIAPQANILPMGNGVDFNYFDPSLKWHSPDLRAKPAVVFLGAMDSYPNSDAACWFGYEVFPQLQRRRKDLEFWVVGRNPTLAVRRLGNGPGVKVTGTVADVRPYLAAAEAVVAPLRMARGVQNKVLEALAMGKRALASPAVCDTFSHKLPLGVIPCRSAKDYVDLLQGRMDMPAPAAIRNAARERYSWSANLKALTGELESILAGQVLGSGTTGGRGRL